MASSEREKKETIGMIVQGVVIDVYRWGVFVDIKKESIGNIDPIYIENDTYVAGEKVTVFVEAYRDNEGQYFLRPLGKVPYRERLEL
ncbi:hypothetical protein GCM10022198_11120 [Klugiella xanthotipulae]|uniref:S1 motif domain-containing protein n=1 Tax=Klugiella xanthotipulae TaxID=244735 RepID=A0A543HYT8_9MICO|nr:hypothetical protein [Klugiella xanthotipulae]TQM63506.1 hypothetical protein FB466_1771 [Klugiella xanthotipulae]